jgi:YfiH family protein
MHDAPAFRIYFGNRQDNLFKNEYLQLATHGSIFDRKPFAHVKRLLHLNALFFLNQVHEAEGLQVTSAIAASTRPFSKDGDFLITQERSLGIGIMSGDCLPIIFYDSLHNSIAIAHAGWKSSVRTIALKTLALMQTAFGTERDHLQIFFGPCAKVCCYQVSAEFLAHLEPYPFANQLIQHHAAGLFFDLPAFNRLQLESAGIKKEAFHMGYNICTICDPQFWSNRREKENAGRQMTVASLK